MLNLIKILKNSLEKILKEMVQLDKIINKLKIKKNLLMMKKINKKVLEILNKEWKMHIMIELNF